MFEFLFKYPSPVFTRGRYVLLGTWPGWVLVLLIVACVGGLGWLMWRRLPGNAPRVRNWRTWLIFGLESAVVALVLLLLWEPAVTVAELKSQQNLIAVLVDDSRSMGITDAGPDGNTARETAAAQALGEVLPGLNKRFQTRVYRMDGGLARAEKASQWKADGTATHINAGLKQLLAETSDLPLGAVVLLTDGAENSLGTAGAGIDVDTINALHNRRIPVHTIGFGKEKPMRDAEMDDAVVASKAIANSRVTATVSFHQHGFAGQKAVLDIRDGEKLLASEPVTLERDGVQQSQTVFFNSGDAGVKNVSFSLEPLSGETNSRNNSTARLLNVSGTQRRVLYVEGEPRWEYKFIRRAEAEDKGLQVVSMVRTTENKIYRQGISDPSELADGFPVRAEDLFKYDAIVLGSVEAGYFSAGQQELLREFVDKRGGGLLFLGGRSSLSDGGWASSSVADLFPTFLPPGRTEFHRDPATVQLTSAGAESAVTRLLDQRGANVERWRKLPYLADYEDPGTPKPGATVLVQMNAGKTMPLLVTQNYGRGKTAVLATSGTWRWQMSSPLGDPSHDLFWQQLLRWLAGDSPGQVQLSVADAAGKPDQVLMDEGHVRFTAEVKDKEFSPAAEAKVMARVIGPGGGTTTVELSPVPNKPGTYQADWTAEKPGSYVAEVTAGTAKDELGKDVVAFRRDDGVAENFHTEQNRALLEKLSENTGGRYWDRGDLGKLPRDISYSEAGISVRDTKELWDMPVVFLLLLGLTASDWLLRRKWGVV